MGEVRSDTSRPRNCHQWWGLIGTAKGVVSCNESPRWPKFGPSRVCIERRPFAFRNGKAIDGEVFPRLGSNPCFGRISFDRFARFAGANLARPMRDIGRAHRLDALSSGMRTKAVRGVGSNDTPKRPNNGRLARR